jgi:hypothetical protein
MVKLRDAIFSANNNLGNKKKAAPPLDKQGRRVVTFSLFFQ